MGPVSCGELPLEQLVREGMYLVERRSYAGAVCAGLKPVGWIHTGKRKKKHEKEGGTAMD